MLPMVVTNVRDRKKRVEVKCSICGEKREISLGAKHNAKDKRFLCKTCSLKEKKKEIVFYYENDYAYFLMKNKEIKVLIDIEDVEILRDKTPYLCGEENYIGLLFNKKRIKLHNLIMNKTSIDKFVVDHINNNIYDNRKSNLRIVTQSQNQFNKTKQSNNKTGFRGIIYSNGSWRVQIRKEKRFVANKRFSNFIDAYSYGKEVYEKEFGKFLYSPFNDSRKKLKFADFKPFDIANGVGIGGVLFTQGCSWKCEQCHNQQTWDFDGGNDFTEEVLNTILNFYKKNNDVTNRLTISGGDPLMNIEVTNIVACEFKRLFPNKELWIYTGFLFEDIKDNIKFKALLELCDVLVDGKFEIDKKDLTLKWKGSTNQRVINVKETLKQNKIVLWED